MKSALSKEAGAVKIHNTRSRSRHHEYVTVTTVSMEEHVMDRERQA